MMPGSLLKPNNAIAGPSRIGRFAMIGFTLLCLSSTCLAETSLTTLRQQTRQLLTEEATSDKDSSDNDAAVSSLCDLYVILRSDPRYATSNMLQGDAAKVRRRLIQVAQRRVNQLQREDVAKPAELSSAVDRAIAESLAKAQTDPASRNDNSVPAAAAEAAGPIGTSPWQLIELIQRVISPDLWDRQGGTATVEYFAMRRVLVVRATTDVHEQIRELLMALR